MIEKLTKEQEDQLSFYRDKWLKIGLCTKPANRPKAEESLKKAYRLAGLEEPKQILWTTSPLCGAIVVSILKNEKLMKSIHKKAKALKTGAQVGAQVRAQVGDQVWDQVGDQVRAQVGTAIYGKEEAGWLGWVSYMRDVLKLVKETEKMVGLIELSENASWIYPYKNIAIISEKPKTINMLNGRLHCETGPSIEYPDGFRVYSLYGLRMPDWIIETSKDKIDPRDILKLTNTEQRYAAMKFVGIDKFLKELKAKEIDSKMGYKLYYLTIEGIKLGPYLKMKDSSSERVFLEGVGDPNKYENLDPTIKTIEDALKWRATKASKGILTKFNLNLEAEA